MADTDPTCEGDDVDLSGSYIAETSKMGSLSDYLIHDNARLGKSVLESLGQAFDTSAWSGLTKTPALDVTSLMGMKTPALDVTSLMGMKTPALDVTSLTGMWSSALETSGALTKLHVHADFLSGEMFERLSRKIEFYNPESPAVAIQIAEADTQIREAAVLAVEEHLDELEEFVSTTTGHSLPEWKELKPSQKWSFAGATIAAIINILDASFTASNDATMMAQMVSGVVIYLCFIAGLEAAVRETRGSDEAGQ